MFSPEVSNAQQSTSVRQKDVKTADTTSKFMKYLSYLYLLGGFISLIANLTKTDVNLAIFAFLYVASIYMPGQKLHGIYLLIFSLIVDVFWIIFVQIKVYSSDEYFALAPWENNIRFWTLWSTISNMGIKILCVAGLVFCDQNLKGQTFAN